MFADQRIPGTAMGTPSLSWVGGNSVPHGCTLRYASINELLRCEAGCAWLSEREHHAAARLSDRRRRRAWLGGRLLLKQVLSSKLRAAGAFTGRLLGDLEIMSQDAEGRAARPVALLAGQALQCNLSIAHTDRHVLVAIAPRDVRVGVDLVDAHFRPTEGFCRLWFTAAERREPDDNPLSCSAALWAIKEAVYKAINRGEPFIPQHFEIGLPRGQRPKCRTTSPEASRCRLATWLTAGDEVAVVATLSESS